MSVVGAGLVGRETELATIAGFARDTSAGALVLRGGPGVGKSVLCDAGVAVAIDAGHLAVRATGVEAERELPLSGLHQLVHALRAHLDAVSEAERRVLSTILTGDVEHGLSPMASGSALLALAEAACAHHPVLLVVDDVQWFDEVSAQAVAFAGRRVSGTGVRMLLVVREEERGSFDATGLDDLGVHELTPDEAEHFLDQRHPGLTPQARTRVLAAAAGNALALEELAGAGRAGDLSDHHEEVPLTRRLVRVFGGRLAELDPVARAELLRGALDGAAAAPSGWARAGRYPMEGIEAAIELGLLRLDARGEPVFRHPLVRSAVVQSATVNERRAAHSVLAARYPNDLVRRAGHLAAATIDPDEAVADELESAARLAMRRGGAVAAIALLRRAAELSPRSEVRNARLAEAAYVAGQAAQLDTARELMAGVQARDVHELAAGVMAQAYAALYEDGDVVRTHRRLVGVLERAGDLDGVTLARLVNVLLAVSQYAADPVLWAATDTTIDALGERVEPRALIYRDAWGDVAGRGRGVRERLLRELLEIDQYEPWDVMRLAVAAYYTDALDEVRSALAAAVRSERSSGAVTNAMTMMHLQLLDQIGSGQWASAEQTGREGLELAREHGYVLFAHQFLVYLGLLAASRGDTEQAEQLRVEVETWARPRRLGLHLGYAEVIGVLNALGAGQYDDAYAAACAIAAPGQFPAYSHQAVRGILDFVEAAVRSGHLEEARVHARAASERGVGDVSPRFGLVVAGALAMTAEESEAGPLFEEAQAHPGAASFPFEHARITLAHGVWLRRNRQYARSRQVLERAVQLFTELGASPWLARAQGELRAAGTTVHHGAFAPVALSAQELQVVRLAAEGLSNKQIGERMFLSPRTVGAHLYRAFPKLGVTTRASLRSALDRAGLGDTTDTAQVGDAT
ncbi:helix-turn-helix transcriptional regulator [Cellulosimicrobium funkei]|uniref:helix-turn-helix transcriptional regulator n=1 Tax=Cellulosimicrobium funkei TaxID=264251 RepID=UPI0030FC6FA7